MRRTALIGLAFAMVIVCGLVAQFLFINGMVMAADALAPQGTPVAPTPTPIPVPGGHTIIRLDGFVLVPVAVPPNTTDEEDNALMVKVYDKLVESGRPFLLLKCIDRGAFSECHGVLKER